MDLSNPLHEMRHYKDALPKDAIKMSRTGVAHGFEHLRYGLKWNNKEKDPGLPVAQIDKIGVQMLVRNDEQRRYLNAVEPMSSRWRIRWGLVREANFMVWGEVLPQNMIYLDSLFWLPAEPHTAMEIIARMASN